MVLHPLQKLQDLSTSPFYPHWAHKKKKHLVSSITFFFHLTHLFFSGAFWKSSKRLVIHRSLSFLLLVLPLYPPPPLAAPWLVDFCGKEIDKMVIQENVRKKGLAEQQQQQQQQQPTTTNNNQQQPTTTNNNQQQPTTTTTTIPKKNKQTSTLFTSLYSERAFSFSKSLPAVKPPFKPPSKSDQRKDALAKLNHRCGAVVKGIASPSSAWKPLEMRPIEERAVAKFNLEISRLQSVSVSENVESKVEPRGDGTLEVFFEGGWLVGVRRWEMRNEWEWGVFLKAFRCTVYMYEYDGMTWYDRIL